MRCRGTGRSPPRSVLLASIAVHFVTVIGFCRWISAREIHPLAVALPYPPPVDPAPYRAAFRCPIEFDATIASMFVFSHRYLTAPLPTSNRLVADLHERFAGQYLRRFDHAQTSYQAREVIIRRLPDGKPKRDQVPLWCHAPPG